MSIFITVGDYNCICLIDWISKSVTRSGSSINLLTTLILIHPKFVEPTSIFIYTNTKSLLPWTRYPYIHAFWASWLSILQPHIPLTAHKDLCVISSLPIPFPLSTPIPPRTSAIFFIYSHWWSSSTWKLRNKNPQTAVKKDFFYNKPTKNPSYSQHYIKRKIYFNPPLLSQCTIMSRVSVLIFLYSLGSWLSSKIKTDQRSQN